MNTQQLSDSLLAACKAAGIEKPGYIAQNANGKVIHHDNQPSRKGWDSIWGGGGIPKRLNHPPYADDWRDSLMEWVEPQGEPLADVSARHPDHIADTSKKIDMQDAIADAYRKHVGRCGLQTYAQTYRHGWQDALAWKGGGDQARGIEAMVCKDIAKRQQVGIASDGKTTWQWKEEK
jgi:hypothetical protein